MSPIIQTVEPTTFATTCSMREWHSTQNVSRKIPVAEPCVNSWPTAFFTSLESKPIRQVTTCQTADQFFNLSEDYTMIIHRLLPGRDEMLDVYHSFVTSVGELSCRTNIFVAICTTAESGIHLCSTEKDSSRCEIACCAWMDSVMYTVSLGLTRLPRGKYLGQLKDELDGGPIIDYIGMGPNDYVYVTRSGKHCH